MRKLSLREVKRFKRVKAEIQTKTKIILLTTKSTYYTFLISQYEFFFLALKVSGYILVTA